MPGKRILCVESQAKHLRTLTQMLIRRGFQVLTATSGAQAVEALAHNDVDGVLVEYNLPDLNGAAVRHRMKILRPDVPVLLFSGVGDQTPYMVRFLDAYLHQQAPPIDPLQDLVT